MAETDTEVMSRVSSLCERQEWEAALKIVEAHMRILGERGGIPEKLKAQREVLQVLTSKGDWYKVLKIEPNADNSTILRAFKDRIKRCHTDRNDCPGAKEACQLITQARTLLTDPTQRAKFNATQAKESKAAAAAAAAAARKQPRVVPRPQAPTAGAGANPHQNAYHHHMDHMAAAWRASAAARGGYPTPGPETAVPVNPSASNYGHSAVQEATRSQVVSLARQFFEKLKHCLKCAMVLGAPPSDATLKGLQYQRREHEDAYMALVRSGTLMQKEESKLQKMKAQAGTAFYDSVKDAIKHELTQLKYEGMQQKPGAGGAVVVVVDTLLNVLHGRFQSLLLLKHNLRLVSLSPPQLEALDLEMKVLKYLVDQKTVVYDVGPLRQTYSQTADMVRLAIGAEVLRRKQEEERLVKEEQARSAYRERQEAERRMREAKLEEQRLKQQFDATKAAAANRAAAQATHAAAEAAVRQRNANEAPPAGTHSETGGGDGVPGFTLGEAPTRGAIQSLCQGVFQAARAVTNVKDLSEEDVKTLSAMAVMGLRRLQQFGMTFELCHLHKSTFESGFEELGVHSNTAIREAYESCLHSWKDSCTKFKTAQDLENARQVAAEELKRQAEETMMSSHNKKQFTGAAAAASGSANKKSPLKTPAAPKKNDATGGGSGSASSKKKVDVDLTKSPSSAGTSKKRPHSTTETTAAATATNSRKAAAPSKSRKTASLSRLRVESDSEEDDDEDDDEMAKMNGGTVFDVDDGDIFFKDASDVEISLVRPGTTWAVYDSTTGAPSWVLHIISSSSSAVNASQREFKYRGYFFEACDSAGRSDPTREEKTRACGLFRRGIPADQSIGGQGIFSHKINWTSVPLEGRRGREMMKIQPAKGEIWAAEKTSEGGISFVEVKFFDPQKEMFVCRALIKLAGWVSIYLVNQEEYSFEIPESAFHWQVPAHPVETPEKHNLPANSIELDPAASVACNVKFSPEANSPVSQGDNPDERTDSPSAKKRGKRADSPMEID